MHKDLDINVMNHKSDNPHQLRNFLLITLLLGNAVCSMAGSKACCSSFKRPECRKATCMEWSSKGWLCQGFLFVAQVTTAEWQHYARQLLCCPKCQIHQYVNKRHFVATA